MSFAVRVGRAITISRPIFWLAPMAAYAAGIAAGGVPHTPFVMWEFLLATFPLSFAVYFLNDYYDLQYDRANPRKGGIWGHKLDDEDAAWGWKLCAFFALLAAITAVISLNMVHASLIASGMLLPFAYSAPPIRLKNRPVLDSLSCAGYFFIPFAAGASLGGSLIFLDYRFLLLALMAASAHALAAVMDYGKDREAGQRTFAVALGPRAPALFACAVFVLNLAFVFPYISPVSFGVFLAAVLSLLLALRPSEANALLVFKSLAAYGILVCYLFLFKYVLLAQQFADYSEPELRFLLEDCDSEGGFAPDALCAAVGRIKENCANGIEEAALPNSCEFIEKTGA